MSFDRRKLARGAFGRKAYSRSVNKPSLDLDFTSGVLDPRITFSRAGTATYIDSDGAMKTAAANVPRFDHDPNKQLPRTNMVSYSSEFNNIYWTLGSVTLNTNTSIGVLGGLFNMSRITDTVDSGPNGHTLFKSLNGIDQSVSGILYTASVYVKAGTATRCRFDMGGPAFSSTGRGATFNLSTGTIVGSFLANTTDAGIINCGGGIYRIWASGVATVTGDIWLSLSIDNGSTYYYQGNGTLNIEAGGFQVEQSSYPSQYVNNTTVSRRYACKGLLIEGSRTNMLLRSAELANASWNKNATTITTPNITVNGTALTVSKISETAEDTHHSISQQVAGIVIGNKYSLQVHLRAAERTFAFVGFNGGGVIAFATINLQNGVISTAVDSGGGVATFKATSMGDGVWMVTGTVTATSTANIAIDIRSSYNGVWDNRQYVGTAGSGIYAWRPQLEVGANASSYIPTTTSAVTRAQDNVTMTGTNFSSWFKQSEGTFLVETIPNISPTTRPILMIGRSPFGAGPRHQLSMNGSSMLEYAVVDDTSSVVVAGLSNGTLTREVATKSAFSFADNSFVHSRGGDVASDTSGIPPSQMDYMQIGKYDSTGGNMYGHMRNIKYWPHRLSNAKLQQLTKLRPTVDMSFTNNKLDSRVTFTRASTATYYDKDGILRTAPINQPRFDYDPVTKQPKGMLIEGSRTNNILQSDNMLHSSWYKNNGIGLVADGTLAGAPAFKITDSSTTQYGNIAQGINLVGPLNATFKIKVKKTTNATTLASMRVGVREGGVTNRLCGNNVNTNTGAQEASTGGWTYGRVGLGVKDGGDHWLMWVTVSLAVNDVLYAFELFPAHFTVSPITASNAHTGEHTFAAPQLEVGAYPSSYIPTTTAPVTRAADVANITGTNFSSVFNLVKQGTLVFTTQMVGLNGSVNDVIVGLFNTSNHHINTFCSSGTNYRVSIHDGTNSFLQNTVFPGTIYNISTSGITWSPTSAYSASDTYIANPVDTAVVIPSVDKLSIGAGSSGNNIFYVRNIRYWPDAVTTTQLQEFVSQ